MNNQERFKINGVDIRQPLEDMKYSFATTYSEDTSRSQAGPLHMTPLFTVEQLSFELKNLTLDEASTIIKMIVKGQKFTLHYYSIYYNTWKDGIFYVGEGEMTIGSLDVKSSKISSLTFNTTGVNPI